MKHKHVGGNLKKIILKNIRMKAVQTDENSIVDEKTIFRFKQENAFVSATYKGGAILKGFIVGQISDDNILNFSYCQLRVDGTLDNGESKCRLSIKNDKIILKEDFKMSTEGKIEIGTNIFEEF